MPPPPPPPPPLAQLLRHPLTRSRLASAAAALDFLVMPLTVLQPGFLEAQQRPFPPGTDAACLAVVRFHHVLLGTLLPALAVAALWRPCARQAVARGGGRAARGGGWAARAGATVSDAAAAADRGVCLVLNGRVLTGGRLMAGWLPAAFTWLCCKQSALPA